MLGSFSVSLMLSALYFVWPGFFIAYLVIVGCFCEG